MKKIFIITIVISLMNYSWAQVGINNPNPDPSAVLDLSGGSNSNKGFLLPKSTSATIGVSSPARGLLVFDSTSNEAYIYDEDSTKWYSVNPWFSEFGSSATYSKGSVIINGNEVITGSIDINPDGLAYFVGQGNFIKGGLTVSGTSFGSGEILADTTAGQEAHFYGNGAVPPGAIMMWSGAISEIPEGWALCDGLPYYASGVACCDPCTALQRITCNSKPNVVAAPNLQGRFVVGYDPADVDYDQINTDKGGVKQVTLTSSEIPAHTHSFSGTTSTNGAHTHGSVASDIVNTGPGATVPAWSGGSGFSNIVSSAGSHNHTFSGTTDSGTGAGQPHENRPPYYTLAYIIKLKFP